MHRLTPKRSLAALGAVAVLALAGCGADSSGQTSNSTPTQAALPVITSPLATTTAPATSVPAGKGKVKTTNTTGGSTAGCTVPDAYQDFKYTGIDCTSAVSVAQAWDQDGKDCNTVDNPNVPEGFKRTCSVEGFTCEAKRDIHSDGRFVTCTQGGQSIRFTWLPA